MIVLITLGSGSLLRAEEAVKQEVFNAVVLEVVDGDTIRLEDGTLVRYLGIDTPELRRKVDHRWVYDPEPFAEKAATFNKALVEGKEVLIAFDPVQKHDRYGRLLAYVSVDQILVNEALLREGLAKVKIPPRLMKHRVRFYSLEALAWTGKRGLWANAENTP